MTPRSYVARSPEDLIALVPYLLGFHPQESVVLLTFGAPAGSFHARVDLPADPEGRVEVSRVLSAAVQRNAVTTTAVLVFSDDAECSEQMCAVLVPELQLAGASVIDAVRADGRCWWSVLDAAAGADPGFDPGADGSPGPGSTSGPHPYDLASHRFTAERVYDGQAALSSRAELAGTLRGADPAEVRQVARAADAVARSLQAVATGDVLRVAREHADWLHDRLVEAARAGEVMSSSDAGRVLALIRLGDLRDVAWGVIDREQAAVHVELWRDLVRRAPTELVSRAAAPLAFAAWLAGDGALAWCAIDRCLEHDPDDMLAHHVAGLLQHAVPPTSWTPVPLSELAALNGWREQAS